MKTAISMTCSCECSALKLALNDSLKRCKIPAIQDGQILDNGCGSGTIGIHFLEASNNSTLLSTDLEPNFLDAAQKKAQRRGIVEGTMQVGIANISNPEQVTTLDQSELKLSLQYIPTHLPRSCFGICRESRVQPENSCSPAPTRRIPFEFRNE